VLNSSVDNSVEEIKKKLNIVEVINQYLPLKKRGRTHMACCPFHGEKTPSFTVSPELQIFKCFGCGKAGDIFTFVQEYEKVDFKEALDILAKKAGVVLKKTDFSIGIDNHKKRLILINNEIAKLFNYILLSHPLGKTCLKYLEDRQISPKTIKEFVIGFAPENDNLVLTYLKKKNITEQELFDTGCFSKSQYGRIYNRFKNRLIFPLCDNRGQILGFSGRVLPGAGENQAKYINSPETEIYHKSDMLFGLNLSKDSIRTTNSVIVTEGEFDMITPYQKGITNIVAVKGTAFTENQLQLLRRYTSNLILALDSDFAGNTASIRSIEMADNMDFDIRILDLSPKFKDPDEAIRGDVDFFKNQMKNTIPVYDFIINSFVKSFGVDTDKGKKQILSSVLPFLVKIKSSVSRSDYLKKLANKINSDIEAVIEESLNYKNNIKAEPEKKLTQKLDQITLEQKLEQNLMTLIFATKKPNLVAKKIAEKIKFTFLPYQTIISSLKDLDKFKPKIFQQSLAPEIASIFDTLYLSSEKIKLESLARSKEINKLSKQLQIIDIKKQLKNISILIANLEENDPENLLETKLLQYNQLLSMLSNLQTKKV
jgi:DNA primase